jgi:hypothetical protein
MNNFISFLKILHADLIKHFNSSEKFGTVQVPLFIFLLNAWLSSLSVIFSLRKFVKEECLLCKFTYVSDSLAKNFIRLY